VDGDFRHLAADGSGRYNRGSAGPSDPDDDTACCSRHTDAGGTLAATEPMAQGIVDPLAGGAPRGEGFTPAEVSILQDLSQRRAELDKRSDDLDHRALLLQALESQVDTKIVKLQQLQTELKALANQVDQNQEQRLASLVHIYEVMKPADAAQILQQMDMPVLVQLLSRMKDQKTAPILAAMDPVKARAVTMALAEKTNLPPDLKTLTQTN
jgi:flagellar motility protein MotE (MotC chaperone)